MNPYLLTEDKFPLIVFSDHTSGIIEFFIKFRTDGLYNHAMWAIAPNTFASQGNMYSKVEFKRYMKKGNRLKFVKIVNLTEEQKKIILNSIEAKLARPWYKKLYDWVGILGQAIGVPIINDPRFEYCSEDVVCHLKKIKSTYPEGSDEQLIIINTPAHANPQALEDYVRLNKKVYETVGKWESDDDQEIAALYSDIVNRGMRVVR